MIQSLLLLCLGQFEPTSIVTLTQIKPLRLKYRYPLPDRLSLSVKATQTPMMLPKLRWSCPTSGKATQIPVKVPKHG